MLVIIWVIRQMMILMKRFLVDIAVTTFLDIQIKLGGAALLAAHSCRIVRFVHIGFVPRSLYAVLL